MRTISDPTRALVLSALVALAPAAAAAPNQEPRRPNILLVYSDDHACAAVSAYGSVVNRTPHIDRLAAEGARFTRSCVANSICCPARATVLTGKHSHANGVLTNRDTFDGAQDTFPKTLLAAGYQTALVGKWHLKSDPTGFEHWEVLLGQGPYFHPRMKSPAGEVRREGYTTHVITERALRWLREDRDAERPFLLMVQHKAPHRHWQPGPDYLADRRPEPFPEPATLFDDGAGRASGAGTQKMSLAQHMTRKDLKLLPSARGDAELNELLESYYGPIRAAFDADPPAGDALVRWRYQRYIEDYTKCVQSVDDSVGALLDYLDEAGLAGDTLVVYTSDQGFFLGEHGWYDKRWMYEESFRTPLVVRWPGVVPEGLVVDALVQNVDLAPTLIAAAGAEPYAGIHGESLVPLLRGAVPEDWRDALYYRYYEFPGAHSVPQHVGVAARRHKLIHYHQLGEWELFDLERDPDELTSVYRDPAYEETRIALELRLAELRAALRDPPLGRGADETASEGD